MTVPSHLRLSVFFMVDTPEYGQILQFLPFIYNGIFFARLDTSKHEIETVLQPPLLIALFNRIIMPDWKFYTTKFLHTSAMHLQEQSEHLATVLLKYNFFSLHNNRFVVKHVHGISFFFIPKKADKKKMKQAPLILLFNQILWSKWI